MATYDIGNQIRVIGAFTDPLNNDEPVDPSSVYFSVRTPEGVVTVFEYGVDSDITKSDIGVYYMHVPLSLIGSWYVRWWGLDSNGKEKVAEEVQIRCTPHQAV